MNRVIILICCFAILVSCSDKNSDELTFDSFDLLGDWNIDDFAVEVAWDNCYDFTNGPFDYHQVNDGTFTFYGDNSGMMITGYWGTYNFNWELTENELIITDRLPYDENYEFVKIDESTVDLSRTRVDSAYITTAYPPYYLYCPYTVTYNIRISR